MSDEAKPVYVTAPKKKFYWVGDSVAFSREITGRSKLTVVDGEHVVGEPEYKLPKVPGDLVDAEGFATAVLAFDEAEEASR